MPVKGFAVRTSIRVSVIILSAVLGLIDLCANPELHGSVIAQQQQQKLKTTVVADNKYGEGGTLETTSDEKLKVVKEVWKDKNGQVKEVYSFARVVTEGLDKENEEGVPTDFWEFHKDGRVVDTFYYDRGERRFGKRGDTSDRLASRTQVKEWIEEIEKRYAKVADAEAKQPTMPPAEKPKPKPKVPVAKGLDPCIVGKWRSEKLGDGTFDFALMGLNNEGIVFEVKPDGSAYLDYSDVQPHVATNRIGNDEIKTTTTITGRVVVTRVVTENGIVRPGEKAQTASNVKVTETVTDGRQPRVVEPKEFFPKEFGTEYVCTDKALRFSIPAWQFRKVE